MLLVCMILLPSRPSAAAAGGSAEGVVKVSGVYRLLELVRRVCIGITNPAEAERTLTNQLKEEFTIPMSPERL